jgi:putative hydrolases of HD superfamily
LTGAAPLPNDQHQVGSPHLDHQLAFLAEADRLKSILRGTTLHDGSRHENTAEHSWHVALFAMVLADQAAPAVQIDRVIRMLLIHDLVEIDAGDAPIHGDHDPVAMTQAEQSAATRIFGLLPTDQGASFRALWDEFEAAETPDAVFAKSLDRVPPVLANLASGGGTWPVYNVTRAQLESRVGDKVRRGAPAVWDALRARLDAWFGVADV